MLSLKKQILSKKHGRVPFFQMGDKHFKVKCIEQVTVTGKEIY